MYLSVPRGLDQLYLGFFFPYGLLKVGTSGDIDQLSLTAIADQLLSLGGLGIWWIYDLARASEPESCLQYSKPLTGARRPGLVKGEQTPRTL